MYKNGQFLKSESKTWGLLIFELPYLSEANNCNKATFFNNGHYIAIITHAKRVHNLKTIGQVIHY